MGKRKDVLTTGEVARICNVAPRTVSKWFDSGQLRGYRIPGSRDRRIPLQQLIRFMKAHGIPLNGLDAGQTRVLIVDNDEHILHTLRQRLTDEFHYEVRTAGTAFESGVAAESFRPHVIVVNLSLPGLDPDALCRLVRETEELADTRLIGIGQPLDTGQIEALRQKGFETYLPKPFDLTRLVRAIEEPSGVPA